MTLPEKVQACFDQAKILHDSNIPFFCKAEFQIHDISWEEFHSFEQTQPQKRFKCGEGVAILVYGESYRTQILINTVPLRVIETVTVEIETPELETA